MICLESSIDLIDPFAVCLPVFVLQLEAKPHQGGAEHDQENQNVVRIRFNHILRIHSDWSWNNSWIYTITIWTTRVFLILYRVYCESCGLPAKITTQTNFLLSRTPWFSITWPMHQARSCMKTYHPLICLWISTQFFFLDCSGVNPWQLISPARSSGISRVELCSW